MGFGPRAASRKNAAAPRDVARDLWSFGYDPATDTVTMGPFTFSVSVAVPATDALCAAIYSATREVDQRTTAELRAEVVQALTDATILCTPLQDPVLISQGHDMRIWLSYELSHVPDGERKELAERVATAMGCG